MILSKDNLIAYLREHYPQFDTSGPVTLSAIGDPDGELPEEGLINYIFKVKNAQRSLIVKQGRENLRMGGTLKIPPDRNRLEYETLKLRAAIVPRYVPEIYYADMENHVFIMEDVSYLPVSGHSLCAGRQLPLLGAQCAEYIAATAFYTSEFYLETDQFRELTKSFMNSSMRHIMETWLFLREHSFSPNPLCTDLVKYVDGDPQVVAQCYLLRHKFMTHTEALIHADLHTANIFADESRLKIIDMEYTFAGPCSYDVGYLLNNFISQYCAAVFRPFPNEAERASFKAYLLRMVCDLYNGFVSHVNEYWEQDAKPVYRSQNVFKQLLVDEFLGDVLGYASVPGLCRALAAPGYQEFELIPDEETKRSALRLFVIVERHLLLNRNRYRTIEEAVSDVVEIESAFLKRL